MNDVLIANWNSVVSPEDTVWYLGDFAMGRINETLPLVSMLNGTIKLIPGNHDRCFGQRNWNEWCDKYISAGFEDIYDAHMRTGRVWPFHNVPIGITNIPHIMMAHFPYNGDSGIEDRYRDERPIDNGITLLHGHTHSLSKVSRSNRGTLQINVGVDAWNYAPVALETIVELINENINIHSR